MRIVLTICVLVSFLMVTPNSLADLINFDDPGLVHDSIITNYYPGVTFEGIENPWVPLLTDLFPAPATVSGLTITGGAQIWNPIASPAPGESTPNYAVGLGYGNPGDGGILMTFATPVSSLTVTGLDYGNGSSGTPPWLDDEYMTLTAYDASGNQMGQSLFTTQFAEGAVRGTIAFGAMTYVAFNYTNTDFGFYGIDDLDFTPVPVPGAILLGILGLSVAGVKLHKHA